MTPCAASGVWGARPRYHHVEVAVPKRPTAGDCPPHSRIREKRYTVPGIRHGLGEYARGDAYTNTAESFFSLLKRGVYGTFHCVSKKHLHRYLAEFEFRWNTRKMDDGERFVVAIHGSEGKRLLYREPIEN